MQHPGNSHWMKIAHRAMRDAVLFVGAYLSANYVRFKEFWHIEHFLLPTVLGALVLVSVMYVLGLYTVESTRRSTFRIHFISLLFGFLLSLVAITLLGYLSFEQRIGRGYMALGCVFSFPLLVLNHWLIYHKRRLAPERIAFVAESDSELAEYERMKQMSPAGVQAVGRIAVDEKRARGGECLGDLQHVREIISRHKISRVVFSEDRMQDQEARQQLRQLRYLGITCCSLISVCETYLHYVPLHLVSLQWLLYSEGTSKHLYFSKLKRLFDIVTSLVLLILLSPFFLMGVIIVRVFSPEGPVFFTQERVGRFGQRFKIWKLRSMRTDAEKKGPVWSSSSKDPRVFPGGAFLRRYRIDEIPQLLNVLKGEMSFVGPRPERPEFVVELAKTLPYYNERHMIQPGLTGWAQVCYPYGSSVEDARCKLEYDLYYLKHAGVVFDLLILLDTVRVVLVGGLQHKGGVQRYSPSMKAAPAVEQTPLMPVMTRRA
ncbi:exopolysaccharide biosynthesis polyprenyl glycosylphosphotransferase [Prosthecobacter sp.]|uniref:exopolysaccharide biosynthesis polyprenyl glycosylphosphotransferase n=1 Tax=Prosthecobacter sp. TaxID=1965333 RepID=UPI003783DDE5